MNRRSVNGDLGGLADPEVAVSRDLVRRGFIVAPVLVLVSVALWGWKGAPGSLIGLVLVLVNFALSAGIISTTARISLSLMMGAVLGGYLLRLGIIFLAVFSVRNMEWLSLEALGATVIITHLGLLFWEMKFVAMSLAFPGLKPNAQQSRGLAQAISPDNE
ncbi:MAG: hypothetical protein RLZ84_1537 [Actinomycetota bacterium]|jgi:hypothetical protein